MSPQYELAISHPEFHIYSLNLNPFFPASVVPELIAPSTKIPFAK
jgi:hypothetical protein